MKIKTNLVALSLAAVLGATGFATSTYAAEGDFTYCDRFEGYSKATCEAVYQEINRLSPESKFVALERLVKAVDENFPDFAAMSNAEYGISLAQTGGPCGMSSVYPTEKNWGSAGCGPFTAKDQLIVVLADIKDEDLDTLFSNPAYLALADKPITELIASAKENPLYASDAEFKTGVTNIETTLGNAETILRGILKHFNPTSTAIDTMTLAQLVADVEALPGYRLYRFASPKVSDAEAGAEWATYYEGVYYNYSQAKYDIADGFKKGDIYDHSYATNYTALTMSAKHLDVTFAVDLADLSPVVEELPKASAPAAPNTGTLGSDSSASIIKIALGAVAGVVGLAGLVYTAKRYIFSPLKRRK